MLPLHHRFPTSTWWSLLCCLLSQECLYLGQLDLDSQLKKIEFPIPNEIFIKVSTEKAGTKKGGRKKGTKNYLYPETMSLLHTLGDVLPVSGEEWTVAVHRHYQNFPGEGRDEAPIKDKLFKLTKKKGGTGNPNMPEDVKLARQVYRGILHKTDLGTAGGAYGVEGGYRTTHQGDPNNNNPFNNLADSDDEDDGAEGDVPLTPLGQTAEDYKPKGGTGTPAKTVHPATNGDPTTMPWGKSMTVRSSVTPGSATKRYVTNHAKTNGKTLETVQDGIERDQIRWGRQMQLWGRGKAGGRLRREEERKGRIRRGGIREKRGERQHKQMMIMMVAALAGGKRKYSALAMSDNGSDNESDDNK